MRSFAKYHLPLLLYAALILTVSSIPNLRTPDLRVLASDKLAHFVEYAVFAFLAFRSTSHLGQPTTSRRPLLLAILLLAGFAMVDEVLQSFIPGRFADWRDYLFDLAGGLAILLALWRWGPGRQFRN